MVKSQKHIRDIVIGIILIIVGAATLLHTFEIFVFDEEKTILAATFVLLGVGASLLIAYIFSPRNIWVLMLALCMFFVSSILYISTFMPGRDELIAVALFVITSLAFFILFIIKPVHWWAMLNGWISLGLAGTIYTTNTVIDLPVIRQIPSQSLPPLVLFTSVAIGFLFVWIMSFRERWWALLTAGMIASVESVIILQAISPGSELIPVILFLCAGLTFLMVWVLRNDEYRLHWAIYPAVVLIGFSSFIYFVSYWLHNSRLVLALIFIVMGLLFIGNYIRSAMSASRKDRDLDPIVPKPESSIWEPTPSLKPEKKEEPEEEVFQVATPVEEEVPGEKEVAEEKPPFIPPVDYPIETDEEDKKEE